MKKTVVLGWYGSTLDAGASQRRWDRWRPTVSLFQHDDLVIEVLELLHTPEALRGAQLVKADIEQVSPETKVRLHVVNVRNAWDFQEVYGKLFDFARGYAFAPDNHRYLLHITTGSHVMQICFFLLNESRHIPGQLIQSSPRSKKGSPREAGGEYEIIDLDLSKYDQLARRFAQEQAESVSFLKRGIATANAAYNRLIDRVERVAVASKEPLLITGPTGSGKSQLARQIFELKRQRKLVLGPLVEVNCATIRGDGAMSALFGHVKGAFTGALQSRKGLLQTAHEGLLFLDEIGELGLDEQAMLLRAIEEKRFLPVGTDTEVTSDFQLIAGTNRDLRQAVRQGTFREDLLARIGVWQFSLPPLRERPEDIPPNLDFEIERVSQRLGRKVTMNREARDTYLTFATSPQAHWVSNFRDLSSSMIRMGTLAESGRIDVGAVRAELDELRALWRDSEHSASDTTTVPGLAEELDPFDAVQLNYVIAVCRQARNLSDAGRRLFAVSRRTKSSSNDADRLKKYLARFGLTFAHLHDRAVTGDGSRDT